METMTNTYKKALLCGITALTMLSGGAGMAMAQDDGGYVDPYAPKEDGEGSEPGNGARNLGFGGAYFGPAKVDVTNNPTLQEGGVNVQGVGKYSTQEGDFANNNKTAQVMWDVQWSPMYSSYYDGYPYMLNETDIFVPKAVGNIHLTLGQAQSLEYKYDYDEGDEWNPVEEGVNNERRGEYDSNTFNYEAVTRNDVRTMIELRKDTGDIDFNSFYQDENGKFKRLYAGGEDKKYHTPKNMLDVGSVAYVVDDLSELPDGTILPAGINKDNLSEYKMIRLASDKKGMHTVRVSGTINVNGANSDVYVPLRATNRLNFVNVDRSITDRQTKEFTHPVTGKKKKAEWIPTGKLPEFSITDAAVNERNAKIYDKDINAAAGFDTTDACKPVTNTVDKQSSIVNSAGLDKINDDHEGAKLLMGQSEDHLLETFAIDDVLRLGEYEGNVTEKYIRYNADTNTATYTYSSTVSTGGWASGETKEEKYRFDIENYISPEKSLKNDSCDQAALKVKVKSDPTTPPTTPETPPTTPETPPTTPETPPTTPEKPTTTPPTTPEKPTTPPESTPPTTPGEPSTPGTTTPLSGEKKSPQPVVNSTSRDVSDVEVKKDGAPVVNTGGATSLSFFQRIAAMFS